MTAPRIVVCGAGVIGASVAYSLASRGAAPVVVDRARPGAAAVCPVQELGTIEAGSKELTTAPDDDGRSPPRSKSVRRSKALERRNG